MLNYSYYKINSLNPRSKDTFYERRKKGFSLEKMILLDYRLTYRDEYNSYLEWCDENEFTPYSNSIYYKYNKYIFTKNHSSILEDNFTGGDKEYIKKFSIYTTERKSYMNQYFCLFWKNYFLRKKKKQEQ